MIFKNLCQICFSLSALEAENQRLKICPFCADELTELHVSTDTNLRSQTVSQLADVTSLYKYRSVIRTLILNAKVRNNHKALKLLIDLAISRMETTSIIAWCDLIMPSPASLWGRFRGRLDLAGHFAASLAEVSGKPLVVAPFELHWRWRKQALAKKSSRFQGTEEHDLIRNLLHRWQKKWCPPRPSPGLKNCRVLIVDDVVTTGKTLDRVAEALAPHGPSIIRGLTIASS